MMNKKTTQIYLYMYNISVYKFIIKKQPSKPEFCPVEGFCKYTVTYLKTTMRNSV